MQIVYVRVGGVGGTSSAGRDSMRLAPSVTAATRVPPPETRHKHIRVGSAANFLFARVSGGGTHILAWFCGFWKIQSSRPAELVPQGTLSTGRCRSHLVSPTGALNPAKPALTQLTLGYTAQQYRQGYRSSS